MQEEENDIPIEEQVEVVDETNMDPVSDCTMENNYTDSTNDFN
jgi:hypothetical protein